MLKSINVFEFKTQMDRFEMEMEREDQDPAGIFEHGLRILQHRQEPILPTCIKHV